MIFIMVRCQNTGLSPKVTEVTAQYGPLAIQPSIIKSILVLKAQVSFTFISFEIIFQDDKSLCYL